MAKRENSGNDPSELRRCAEERLRESGPGFRSALPAESERLLHELQVHQVELELQNEELRQVRQRLEAALDQYIEIYELAPVAYYTLDRSGRILRTNLPGAELLECERSHLEGKSFARFVAPADQSRFESFLRECCSQSWKGACELRLTRANGGEAVVQFEAACSVEGREVRAAVLDVTMRKQAEESAGRMQAAAEEANRAKGDFLGNMSHEIRTPLNGIVGMTQLLLNSSIDAEQREYLEAIKYSSNSLKVIIEDLFDLSKLAAGKIAINSAPFRLRSLIDHIRADMVFPANEQRVELSIDVKSGVPDELNGDETRIGQVLLNLLGNAIKFTPAGGKVSLVVTTEGNSSGGSALLRLSVSDTGIGIPAESLRDIFQAFKQLDPRQGAVKNSGAGLGLSISKAIVERMGGRIWAESKVGAGSTFFVSLELPHSTHPEAEWQAVSGAATAVPLRVLVADDNPVGRRAVVRWLEKRGHNVTSCASGRECVEYVQKNGGFDLVLMDCMMPDMDGFEATAAIRQTETDTGKHLRIIAMTALAQESDEKRCLEAGMDGYIPKPVNLAHLEQLMTESGAGWSGKEKLDASC